MDTFPFRKGSSFQAFQHQVDSVLNEIRGLDNGYLLRSSATELENYFLEKVRINPLILHSDDLYVLDQKTRQIDARNNPHRFFLHGDEDYKISGTEIVLAIPYEGDKALWDVQPSYSSGGCPKIDIGHDTIVFRHVFADETADQARLKAEIDNQVKALRQNIANLKNDVDQHNANAPERIKQALDEKRRLALSATNVVTGLGIPMKKRDQPATYIAPVQRRNLPVARPRPATGNYSPEPTLEESSYEHILSVTRSLSLVIERNPTSFATLDEESIRDHMLIQLNGHYEGAATGETFNHLGKTDILVRDKERNIFIAECKFWHGPKKFDETIDQLLDRYLTWRDCKCALLIFNRQADSAGVARKMHEGMQAHKSYRKTVNQSETGNSRYIFVKESEPGREIIITTQVFDIPTFAP